MKIVAVSQRVDMHPERNERRDALDQRLIQWLAEAGYLPVPVPNALNTTGEHDRSPLKNWLPRVKPDALLLSGGNDIGEQQERDSTERCLLAYAKDRAMPVLGICRGMQMMGMWAGTVLKPVHGHVRTRHVLHGEIAGEVNSFHNFSLANCPADYVITAYSEDEEIEAIRHKTLPWEGWMWHPEREAKYSSIDTQRLRALFA